LRTAEIEPISPGELLWLDDRTIGQVVISRDKKAKELHVINLHYVQDGSDLAVISTVETASKLPPVAENFAYSPEAKTLVSTTPCQLEH
jgi:hypothetical protein